jgi:hypothetical protein
MFSKYETNGSTADAFDMATSGARMRRGRAGRLMAAATAALACALAAGCLEMEDPEELQGSDESADIDGELLDDRSAVPEAPEPVGHEDIVAGPEIAHPDDVIPREILGFQGDKGETRQRKPGAGEISTNQHASWSFVWNQGWGNVPMGSASDRFCFLTEVQGRFAGGGEAVYVFISGGSWWLGGRSYAQDVRARALCIPRNYYGQFLSYTGEYAWSQGQYPTYMGSDTNRVCFLTHVAGEFEGGGEQVEAYRAGGSWWLGGTGYQAGVWAGARCVNTIYRNGPYVWAQGQSSVIMSDASWWACGLNRMAGDFAGGAERVSAFVSGAWWYLGGSSYQSGVSTASYCL